MDNEKNEPVQPENPIVQMMRHQRMQHVMGPFRDRHSVTVSFAGSALIGLLAARSRGMVSGDEIGEVAELAYKIGAAMEREGSELWESMKPEIDKALKEDADVAAAQVEAAERGSSGQPLQS